MHQRSDPEIRELIFDAYGKGQVDAQEYEDLLKQASSLLKLWGAQRREVSTERIKLRYLR
mgnify:FL=1